MTQPTLPGADRRRCVELKRDGTRCTRWAYSDTDRCRQHGDLVKPRTPTGLTEAGQDALFEALKTGLALDQAVVVAGVSRSTVYDWLARAREVGSAPEYAEFAATLELARTELERKTLEQMAAAARKGNVRAQIYLLEQVNPERYVRARGAGQLALPVTPRRRPASDDDDGPDNVVPMRRVSGDADW